MGGPDERPSTAEAASMHTRFKHPKRVPIYFTLAGVFTVLTGVLMRQRMLDPDSTGPGKASGVMAGFGPCPTSLEQQAAQKLISEKHEERKLMGQKETHGILPNEWIVKKLNEWLGPPDPKPTSPPVY